MFILEKKDNEPRNGKLNRRDVVLTTRGTIGNIALYDASVAYDHIRINSRMLIFRPDKAVIKSECLFEMLRLVPYRLSLDALCIKKSHQSLPER
jgi:hypothetical protein